MKIGCHVGNSGPLMLAGSIKEALSYNPFEKKEKLICDYFIFN